MRLAHGSRGHPAVADAATAVAVAVVDTAVAAKVASEGATRSPHTVRCFSRLAKLARGSGCRRAQGLLRPRRLDAERRLHRLKLLTKVWAGLDSNQRRRKASRFTVCPVWPLRYLPVNTTKSFPR